MCSSDLDLGAGPLDQLKNRRDDGGRTTRELVENGKLPVVELSLRLELTKGLD